jgi:hypothetical protein
MGSRTALILVFSSITVALALAAWLSVRLAGVLQSTLLRLLLAAATSFCFLAAPAASVLWLTALMKVWYRIWYIDLPLPILLVPVLAAVLVASVAVKLTHPTRLSRALVVTYAWAGFFGAVNIFNGCAPGWCGRYGFPFPYYEWSDATLSFNGLITDPFRSQAVVQNAVVFLAVAFPLLLISSRTAHRTAA